MTRVYIASNMPTAYPYKLQKPSTVNDRVRNTAESFIMDSGIGDDVDTSEILDLAHEYNADYVVAKDYLHDQDKTTESIKDFVVHHREHECDATPMIPLQPPHAEHYRDLTRDAGLYDHYVLGGMAVDDVSTTDAVEYIREFANTVHDSAYVHALGVGGGLSFIREVAGRGWVDSIDCSTPELAASFGCVLDESLRQREVREFNGDGASKRNYPLAEFNSWQVQDVWNREIADCESESRQATLL